MAVLPLVSRDPDVRENAVVEEPDHLVLVHELCLRNPCRCRTPAIPSAWVRTICWYSLAGSHGLERGHAHFERRARLRGRRGARLYFEREAVGKADRERASVGAVAVAIDVNTAGPVLTEG